MPIWEIVGAVVVVIAALLVIFGRR